MAVLHFNLGTVEVLRRQMGRSAPPGDPSTDIFTLPIQFGQAVLRRGILRSRLSGVQPASESGMNHLANSLSAAKRRNAVV